MRAMVFDRVGSPLRATQLPRPTPAPGQLLLKVRACGVCRTDLHLLDGEVAIENPPRVLGHQIVASVEHGKTFEEGRQGPAVDGPRVDEPAHSVRAPRIGVPWLGWTCGECEYCRSGRENLCPKAKFTGRDIDGGMAEWAVADERYCFPIPEDYPDEQAAPLLCAGLIGWRALRMCGDAKRLGLYGFGAAAHIIAQVAKWQGREVYAVTRPGDSATQSFALELGATWAGGSDELLPTELEAAIIFAPDGALIPKALRALTPGGTVVCGGIHMSEIPSFPYELLWQERSIRSVANLTRADATEFLKIAPEVPVKTHVTTYPLAEANEALADLRAGRFTGAAVLVP
ncbi:MAG TPA: zinc-dependent alcohol dehydrogenase family protein [Solirubrobacteraceae bacterium]|jgi:propanol-preferring alcohol dehydrogenase|nr:zinc-dependent alcohol dehydrogenase family protein [Solirubrobacteraceae bacterium]